MTATCPATSSSTAPVPTRSSTTPPSTRTGARPAVSSPAPTGYVSSLDQEHGARSDRRRRNRGYRPLEPFGGDPRAAARSRANSSNPNSTQHSIRAGLRPSPSRGVVAPLPRARVHLPARAIEARDALDAMFQRLTRSPPPSSPADVPPPPLLPQGYG